MRILVIEDDADLGPWLRDALEAALGGADRVATLDEAEAALKVRPFDLVVMDRRLPDGDAVTLIARMRMLSPRPSILVLTALDDPNEIARALNAGADDYLAKPFEPVELIARARAVLRRNQLDQKGVTSVSNLRFDTFARTAYVDDQPLILPRRELALLEALMRRAGQVVLRESLDNAVYGFDDEIQSNAIDAHLSRLRKRLREAGCRAEIKALRGIGYLMAE
ncbi:MAG: two-component system response regulator [Rhizobiales bacterium 24-66-13]|uniref:response regulator transcription factor n=1 Tax=Roseixanthobacter psychrophilus TaxID=3119917 RepID=UPI000BD61911|nr:MAG: two-component system response regulator [Rhizobiales bacterium 12-66-7]OYX68568.1 MAG: two-component system response regulator [Rhizobiales bacterium 32-66-11]OYZ83165.1 MAG: two-component system response regulator [Rhizobiales bacterium 24-66-13]OZB11145.1 MAG: two-component system response regulator [Rhizobiales bacterium 39-66-18]HQS09141.1 response regulator transcription factor [Xanthobacteraceae bacterium]